MGILISKEHSEPIRVHGLRQPPSTGECSVSRVTVCVGSRLSRSDDTPGRGHSCTRGTYGDRRRWRVARQLDGTSL